MKTTKRWWLLTILGVLITILGFRVYSHPIENYITLSILFSGIVFISGILEIIFAISNSKIIKGWGWLLSAGLFDLIIGLILITTNLTVVVLPLIFGIWLVFRGGMQINRGILQKETSLPGWGWPIAGGILVIFFGFMVIYNPVFGAMSLVTWTALSLIILGVFTIMFSLMVKKIETYIS